MYGGDSTALPARPLGVSSLPSLPLSGGWVGTKDACRRRGLAAWLWGSWGWSVVPAWDYI